MSARLLALDLGMSCGWAVFGPTGEREISGTWKLGKDKTRGRYGELLLRLQTAVGMNCIGAIAYEHVHHHTGIDASHVYGGWLAVLDRSSALEWWRKASNIHRPSSIIDGVPNAKTGVAD